MTEPLPFPVIHPDRTNRQNDDDARWVAVVMPMDVYRSYKGALDRAIAGMYQLGSERKTVPPVLPDPSSDAGRLDDIQEYARVIPFYGPADPYRWREPTYYRLETPNDGGTWYAIARTPFAPADSDLAANIEKFLVLIGFRPVRGRHYRVFSEHEGRDEMLLEWTAEPPGE